MNRQILLAVLSFLVIYNTAALEAIDENELREDRPQAFLEELKGYDSFDPVKCETTFNMNIGLPENAVFNGNPPFNFAIVQLPQEEVTLTFKANLGFSGTNKPESIEVIQHTRNPELDEALEYGVFNVDYKTRSGGDVAAGTVASIQISLDIKQQCQPYNQN